MSSAIPERIVSLVPNATEILFALGAGDRVVAVSHECDYPERARRLPQLTASALPTGLASSEIDRAVSGQLASGHSLYTLDQEALEELHPDLIFTQDVCPVCAVSHGQVDEALAPLASCPPVVSLDPSSLADVFADIRQVGELIGRAEAARSLVEGLEDRLRKVRDRVAHHERRRVVALEWLDPPFIAGHWVPEMIEAAGGLDIGGRPGCDSRRTNLAELVELDADLIIAMPCGFDEEGSQRELETLTGNESWESLRAVRNKRVHPVDANGCFSRPGPRLIDGIEQLARFLLL